MSTPTAGLQGFSFQKNLSLLNQSASLGFSLSTQLAPDVIAALGSNTNPFPPRDIDLAEVGLKASTPSPIEFARGADKISFSAEGGGFAGLGVYHTGAALLQRIGDKAQDFSLSGLDFNLDANSMLGILRWGFDASAKANGAMALGAVGSATLTVSGNAAGLFGVIRRFASNTPARTVVQSTADSWMLPKQITSADQLEPGTWIIAEVMGGISLKLAAQVGYDFNWVRAAQLGGLSGDIGLRLQMGVNAAIGFSSSGRCAVVVSRESSAKTLRLRYFRLKTREIDASFDASLSVQAVDKLLPDKIDDFISAVFDTHGLQILNDLKVLEKWTDPNTPLSTLLANAGVEGAENLIAHLAGVTPQQLQQEFDAVHDKVTGFITKWRDLPQKTSSVLLKLVEKKVDLSSVKDIASRLSTITSTGLKDLLNTELNKIDFFQTPAGQLLESLADQGVLSLLAKPIEDVNDVAKKVMSVLDGSLIEDALKKFQSYVESELHLDKVLPVVMQTDFASLDALLKKKLATFLGQNAIVLADLDKVRKIVGVLLQKRQEYYEKALAALHKKYTFDLTATYQSTTTDQALFDASFDFSQNTAAVSGFLQQAVRGQLDDLLTSPHPQVTIGAAKISHGIKRQTTVDVTLPFMSSQQLHLNESLASVEATSQDGGLLFALHSSDTMSATTVGNQRRSVLSLVLSLATSDPNATGVRVHQNTLETNYTMLYAKRNMRIKDVRAQVIPAVATYFTEEIPDPDALLTLIDRRTEEEIPNTPNVLGNGLVSLQVSLSPDAAKLAGRAWLSLPSDRKAPVYQDMSRGIQDSLKRNVHDSFFVDPDAYSNLGVALPVLAYCALTLAAPAPSMWGGLPLWDSFDRNERKRMLLIPQTQARMTYLLTEAQKTLQGDSQAQYFRPQDAKQILDRINVDNYILNGLLVAEADVIKHAFEGGLQIGKFSDQQAAKPTEAVTALALFGSRLTTAFNADITSILGPGMRTLGTRVFLDAARAIDRSDGTGLEETNVMLSMEFLKAGAAFDGPALLSAGHVDSSKLAFADRVVRIA